MKNVFIFGSCVSRDSVDIAKDKIKVVDYYSRSSFASLQFSSPSFDLKFVESMESNFQKKMVLRDINKEINSYSFSDVIDVVLIDFIDERFKTFKSKDGGVATLSFELSKVLPKDYITHEISNSDTEYFLNFEIGFKSFIKKIRDKKLKIKLIKAFWTNLDTEGGLVEKYSDSWINKENDKLSKLYKIANTYVLDDEFIEVPSLSMVLDRNHRWGLAPYHYVNSFYTHVVDTIEK